MNSSSEVVRLVHFDRLAEGALDRLLLAERESWESVLHWEFGSVAGVISHMVASHLLSGFALAGERDSHGYLYHFARDGRIIFGGMYFTPEYRSGQWPRLMMERALDDLHPLLECRSIEGQVTFPGPELALGPLLAERGFQLNERRFMRLGQVRTPSLPPAPSGLSLRPLSPGTVDVLALAMHKSFQDHVDKHVSMLYWDFQGCRRLLDLLILKDGCGAFEPGCSFTARLDDDLAGGIVVTRISKGNYFVAQVFVHPRCQGLGIGQRLLGGAMAAIARQDPDAQLALTVTLANRRAYEWYLRAGFKDVIPHFSFMKALAGNSQSPTWRPEPKPD